jgi:hypothetical protein
MLVCLLLLLWLNSFLLVQYIVNMCSTNTTVYLLFSDAKQRKAISVATTTLLRSPEEDPAANTLQLDALIKRTLALNSLISQVYIPYIYIYICMYA